MLNPIQTAEKCHQSHSVKKWYLRVHPLLPLAILNRPQKFGWQRSQRSPPTPGIQEHWPVLMSQRRPYEPTLHWHKPASQFTWQFSLVAVYSSDPVAKTLFIIIIIIIIIIYLPRVCKSNNNNSEQTVGQDSKATQDALITAHKNYAYTKETQHLFRTVTEDNQLVWIFKVIPVTTLL